MPQREFMLVIFWDSGSRNQESSITNRKSENRNYESELQNPKKAKTENQWMESNQFESIQFQLNVERLSQVKAMRANVSRCDSSRLKSIQTNCNQMQFPQKTKNQKLLQNQFKTKRKSADSVYNFPDKR